MDTETAGRLAVYRAYLNAACIVLEWEAEGHEKSRDARRKALARCNREMVADIRAALAK